MLNYLLLNKFEIKSIFVILYLNIIDGIKNYMTNNSRILDQFYTKPKIAKYCFDKAIEIIQKEGITFTKYLEPSAGTGSFYTMLPANKLGIDLDPKINEVIKADFLTYSDLTDIYFTIGNPPFGKNSNLAIKFFNKCATVSIAIGFIVPKTFKKNSVKSKLDPYFHLIFEQDLPTNSFEFKGSDKGVPCVFQIWIKKSEKRNNIDKLFTDDFCFVKDREGADFAFQRVGVNAGKIKDIDSLISSSSHYFIKMKKENVRKILEDVDWNTVKHNTAGNPSISKQELISLYTNGGITK